MSVLVINTNITFVSGFTRGLVIDSYRNKIQFIPNSLIDFINFYSRKTIPDGKKCPHGYSHEIILEYLDFLISNEFCFLVDTEEHAKRFINNQLTYDSPHILTNCIFQIGSDIGFDTLNSVLSELVSFECWFVEFFVSNNQVVITKLLSLIKKHKFNCIFLYINGEYHSDESINILIESIKKIVVAPNSIKSFVLHIYGTQLTPLEISISNVFVSVNNKLMPQNINCGAVKKEYFSLHIENVRESPHYNSCLNRKITIDYEGNIKNCPSMQESFGNIRDTTLAEALEKPGFKKYWDINKDKIHVCKDCEFRYICTDCRAYVEDPEDILSKPLKCGYNPYTGEWSEWSTNPLKQKAIDFYGKRDLVNQSNKNTAEPH